jgi:hypothetical protein
MHLEIWGNHRQNAHVRTLEFRGRVQFAKSLSSLRMQAVDHAMPYVPALIDTGCTYISLPGHYIGNFGVDPEMMLAVRSGRRSQSVAPGFGDDLVELPDGSRERRLLVRGCIELRGDNETVVQCPHVWFTFQIGQPPYVLLGMQFLQNVRWCYRDRSGKTHPDRLLMWPIENRSTIRPV